MPDISKITLPSGTTYDIKDAKAREALTSAIYYRGYTTTKLTDGATTDPITIDGESYVPQAGDVVIYKDTTVEPAKELEFIYHTVKGQTYRGIWNEFGSTGALKALAFANTASETLTDYVTGAALTDGAVTSTGTYTPAGSISTPTITVTPTTTTVQVLDEAGSVTDGEAATFTEGAFTPNVPTTIDTTKFSGGSKAADTFSAGTLPSKAADTWSAGTLPSKAADTFSAGELGSYTPGTLPTLTTTVSGETLAISFDRGALGSYSQGTLPSFTEGQFSAGTLPSYTEGSFDAGSLPTFSEGAFTPAALASGFYTPGTAASKEADTFDGGAPTEVTLPTFAGATVATGIASATSTQPTFTGTEGNVSVSGSVGTAISLTTTNKTITVNPDNA